MGKIINLKYTDKIINPEFADNRIVELITAIENAINNCTKDNAVAGAAVVGVLDIIKHNIQHMLDD